MSYCSRFRSLLFCSCDVFRALFLNSLVCWCFVYAACSYFEYVLSLHHHHYQHQQQHLLLPFRKCFFVFFKLYFISSNVFYASFSFSGLFISSSSSSSSSTSHTFFAVFLFCFCFVCFLFVCFLFCFLHKLANKVHGDTGNVAVSAKWIHSGP